MTFCGASTLWKVPCEADEKRFDETRTIVDPFVKTVNEVFLRCENVLVFLSFSFSL